MTKLAQMAAWFAAPLVVMFCLGAFIEWKINPGDWSILTRVACGLIGVWLSLMVAALNREDS